MIYGWQQCILHTCKYSLPRDIQIIYKYVLFCSVPYDLRTIHGFLVTYIIEIIGTNAMLFVSIAVNTTYYIVCWYLETLLTDLIKMMEQSDQLAPAPTPERGAQNLKKEMVKIVKFHNNIIR